MIPKGWNIQPLEAIALVTSGGTPSRTKPDYWNGNIPWVRTTEVQNCVIYHDNIKEFISKKGLDNSSAKIIPLGSILMAMIGQGKTRGQVALLAIDAACNQNSAAIIFHKGYSSEFFYNYLKSQYQNIRNFSNSAGQSNLSGALVKSIRVPVPPLPEQKKIAQILSTWDKVIETVGKLIANSQQKKKALMQQLLTGKKRFPEFDGEWKEVRLVDIGEISSAGVDKKIVESEKSVRLLNYLDVLNRDFIEGDQLNHWVTAPDRKIQGCNIQQGDVFFTPSSETRDDIAHSAVALETIPDTVYSYHIVRFRLHENWDLLFRTYAFKTPSFYKQAFSLCEGGGQRYVISQRYFRNMRVRIPTDIEEQKRIAAVLFSTDQEIETWQQELEHLKQEKKALMQQLLTGKRRVKVDAL